MSKKTTCEQCGKEVLELFPFGDDGANFCGNCLIELIKAYCSQALELVKTIDSQTGIIEKLQQESFTHKCSACFQLSDVLTEVNSLSFDGSLDRLCPSCFARVFSGLQPASCCECGMALAKDFLFPDPTLNGFSQRKLVKEQPKIYCWLHYQQRVLQEIERQSCLPFKNKQEGKNE